MPLPTVILPGYLAGAKPYQEMEQTLKAAGIPTVTVPLLRRDWFPSVGGRSMAGILTALDRTVSQVMQKYDTPKVNIIGHSAGGWITRIYLGEKPYCIHGDVKEDTGLWDKRDRISTLLTLGTPHFSQERWTRKNLDFVNQNYPGAFYPDVRYVCIAGKAVFGEKRLGKWFIYSSYQLTCGVGNTWGDGITPVEAAHLENAENITLDDVWHSPSNPGLWYGSPTVIKNWLEFLL